MKRSGPSGSQKRKIKKARAKEAELLSGLLLKYVNEKKSSNENEDSNIEVSSCHEETQLAETERHKEKDKAPEVDLQSKKKLTTTIDASQLGDSSEDINCIKNLCLIEREGETSPRPEPKEGTSFDYELLDSNDAANWPMPLPDHIRLEIIKKGSETFQHKDGPFISIVRQGEHAKGPQRSLTTSWFYSTVGDGKKYLRKWMIYSTSTNMLYCFCCRLFASMDDLSKPFISGYQKWWKLNPNISLYESSHQHVSNLEKWKTLAVGLKKNETIDKVNEDTINREAKKWRNILHRLLDITLFLAQQNLAFRGHREDPSSENRGNFIELVKVMAKYDPVLSEHWSKLQKAAGGSQRVPSYLSKGIQNEFLSILSHHVKQKIIDDIKKSKYFGIMFDSTPDESHTDQMSEIIRYVHVEEGAVEVRESFLGFFSMSGKTANDMANDILKQLEKDGLDIQLCRAQGYDNAASMSGVHGGVQKIIRDINPKALFSPCANHSLNLCGVHSFACIPSSVTCFGTLEKIYSFFSASTHRWEILMQKVGKTLKRLCDTRRSAHHDSVKAVRQNVEQLVHTLEEMCDPSKENLDTRSAASVLLPAICDFTFLCYLEFWNMILEEVNLTQKYLQTPEITLDMGLIKMKALQLFLVEERNTLVTNAIQFGTHKCTEMGIDIERRGRRKVKKNLPGETSSDARLTLQEEVRRSMFECLYR
ncbi:52 kDa repressor of the inhibitor of the protein kinase-like [Helicoverpa zea]|uniref:52 kDa repressor of the inhibitor of the protein kinase-like n=1 Tax=Helicoverpa zea TaxID=7113 RepID=UPI001F58CF4B|nr:52 kDa repressor of the inhibitor of the protein kinase-like [Helicoverpa zea]